MIMGTGIDNFVDGTRRIFSHADDARAQAQAIAAELQVLLARPDLMREIDDIADGRTCLLYTSPSPRDGLLSRMPSSA